MDLHAADRMVPATSSSGTEYYAYGPSNERVWKRIEYSGGTSCNFMYFYGADGALLTTNGVNDATDYNVYFGGRQVYRSYIGSSGTVIQDRLGSAVRQYFPYGDEPTTTTQDRVKYATYFRDEVSTLDYARNRYYSSTIARFTTADPYGGSARPGAPQTWNRYAYVGGDPVNFNDPSGLCDVAIAGIRMAGSNSAAFSAYGAPSVTVYPYSETAERGLLAGGLQGVLDVAIQAMGTSSSTVAALYGILLAAQDDGPINVTTFSGGAQAFTAAVSFLNSHGYVDVTSRIGNINYISPGAAGSLYDNGNAVVLFGTGLTDSAATFFTSIGVNPQYAPECGHDFACIANHFSQLLWSRSGPGCSTPVEINNAAIGIFDRPIVMNSGNYDQFRILEILVRQRLGLPAYFAPTVTTKGPKPTSGTTSAITYIGIKTW